MNQYTVKSDDAYELSVHTFEVENPKAVIQIIHGMEEHQERYEPFARFLNDNGYTVVTSDMRGHGFEAQDLGYFSDKKGYEHLIKDQVAIRDFISEHFQDLPVYLFAHSMGTIISRVLLQEHSQKYKKVVLSGYPNYQWGAHAGIFFSSLIRAFKGPKHKSKFLQSLSVGTFNNAVENPKTDVDWISYNEENLNAYINDPYCGIGFTCSAFNDLYHLVIQMHKPKLYRNVHHEMPILLVRGIDDPCVGGEKGANDSFAVLKKAGFQSIFKIDYPHMRHEILNEKEYQRVYNDVLAFFDK